MISPTWGPPRRRQRWGESRLFSRITRTPACGKHGCHDSPKPSPDLAVSLALPGGCLQVGLDGHQQSLVRDRGLRSPALCWWALSGGLLPGFHGVERGTGKTPGRTDPLEAVGQTRAGRGGGTHRRDLRRPKGPPDVRTVGLQQFHLHDQLPDPLHGDVQFRLHRIALAFLEEASIPAIAFSRHCSPENLHAQLPRQKFHRLATQKPQGNLLSPSTAGQVPAGLPAKPGPGKTWTSQARPRLPQAHQQQLCSQNCRSCSGPPWTLRLSQFCVQGNRVRLTSKNW